MPRRRPVVDESLTKAQLLVRRADLNSLVFMLEHMMADASAAAKLVDDLSPEWKTTLRRQRDGWKSLLKLVEKRIHDYGVRLDVLMQGARVKAQQGKAYADDPQAG